MAASWGLSDANRTDFAKCSYLFAIYEDILAGYPEDSPKNSNKDIAGYPRPGPPLLKVSRNKRAFL
eukprot:6700937-Pyramimonas_sp.AAC.1